MKTLEERVAHMPIRSLRPAGLIAACAATILLSAPGTAGAKSIVGDLRVLGPSGQTLAELDQYTRTVKLDTDPNAQCFGPGSGGSGDRVKVPGPTALGVVNDAAATARDLRPLSLTDAFDFGLGVCGIGGFQAQGSAFWYLKHNHAGALVGGDQLRLSKGDEVLWYLAPGFPPPPELSLEAPARVNPGEPINVQVFAHADDGTRTPAAGATVAGGGSPVTTNAQGTATVPAGSGNATLRATRGADIPSNEVRVCVSDASSECSPQRLIAGTKKRDKIKGTSLAENIKAKAQNDVVKAGGGSADRVNCGTGKRDVAVVDADDAVRACERVKEK
jgi:hypothetical protein